jgi:hypothetical protein
MMVDASVGGIRSILGAPAAAQALFFFGALLSISGASAHSSLLIPTSRNALIDRGLTEFDNGAVRTKVGSQTG